VIASDGGVRDSRLTCSRHEGHLQGPPGPANAVWARRLPRLRPPCRTAACTRRGAELLLPAGSYPRGHALATLALEEQSKGEMCVLAALLPEISPERFWGDFRDHQSKLSMVHALEVVSCPAPGRCIAVDYAGNVIRYSGGRWRQPTPVDPGGGYYSVSCRSTFCMAVDGARAPAVRVAVRSAPIGRQLSRSGCCGRVPPLLGIEPAHAAVAAARFAWPAAPGPSDQRLAAVRR
jgi:hypothetical protein